MKNLPEEIFERKESLVGFSSSLLKHYGVIPFHESDPRIDQILRNHRKICVFLFDGAGKFNLELYPKTNSFILGGERLTINSTNPPTTVAATNAFLTAKWPMENGWLGWTEYIEELGFPLCVFPDINDLTGEKVNYYHDDSHFFDKYCPLTKIDVYLREKGVNAKLEYLYPLGGKEAPKNYKEMGKHATEFFKNGGEFLYSYTPHPDHEMHSYGVKNIHVWNEFRKINKMLKKFVKENPDVLVITMADHGLIDVEYLDMAEHPDLLSTFSGPISIEGRNCSFKIKEDKKGEFEALFRKYYPSFVLLNKKEVDEKGIFGVGKKNEHYDSIMGDYLAIALDKYTLYSSKQNPKKMILKGNHAGQTKEEREINLSFFNL